MTDLTAKDGHLLLLDHAINITEEKIEATIFDLDYLQ